MHYSSVRLIVELLSMFVDELVAVGKVFIVNMCFVFFRIDTRRGEYSQLLPANVHTKRRSTFTTANRLLLTSYIEVI